MIFAGIDYMVILFIFFIIIIYIKLIQCNRYHKTK